MDKEEHHRWLNNKRFVWHEAVLKDPVILQSAVAVALAGHVMHKYVARNGCAQFSIASAAKALSCSPRQLKRARKLLQQRGWIRPDERPASGNWRAKRYTLGGGPEDLLFENDEGGSQDTDG
jgi:hypothetical protein